jgi:hypothetical protein
MIIIRVFFFLFFRGGFDFCVGFSVLLLVLLEFLGADLLEPESFLVFIFVVLT